MDELVTNTVRILQGKPELKIVQDRFVKFREQNPKLASGRDLPATLFRQIDVRLDPDRVERRVITRRTNPEEAEEEEEEEAVLAEAELGNEPDLPVSEQATTALPTTRRKTIIGFGKGGHPLKAVFTIFLDLAGDLLPEELVQLYDMLARVDNIITAVTFPVTLLKELEHLTRSFYDSYEKFMAPYQIPVPPNFRRFVSLAELIAFSGPPVTGNTRSWESRHVIMRELHETTSGRREEAQVLQALLHRSLFLMPALRSFARYPREKSSKTRVWSDLTLPVKADLPPSQVRALRRWYSEELAEPGLDPTSLSWSGFKSAFLGQHAITQGSHLLIEDQSSKRVHVIRAKSFWRIGGQLLP